MLSSGGDDTSRSFIALLDPEVPKYVEEPKFEVFPNIFRVLSVRGQHKRQNIKLIFKVLITTKPVYRSTLTDVKKFE